MAFRLHKLVGKIFTGIRETTGVRQGTELYAIKELRTNFPRTEQIQIYQLVGKLTNCIIPQLVLT